MKMVNVSLTSLNHREKTAFGFATIHALFVAVNKLKTNIR